MKNDRLSIRLSENEVDYCISIKTLKVGWDYGKRIYFLKRHLRYKGESRHQANSKQQ